ncbi:MAG: glycosyltransferase [Candidatus Scalindua rubra]|uniref:Glycosyltransferase n=1 Tax=Candidatus Scalindua rubra TaxID=1872076 RepID=A0A1E3XC87_9BACT|nr:MAG: glycosyltransferase [Candidatus Scalindua rubra]
MAKPVVATPVSCGSLPIAQGENILIANTPEQFATHTLSLLNDAALRKKIGTQARNDIVNNFSWDMQIEKYDALYQKVLKNGRNNISKRDL